jgi:hypothetical protein
MKRIFILFTIALFTLPATAKEGMWIPLLLSANEAEMQAMGLELTAEDIYSINNGSLKDAIVHFGGFCTGEIISDQGLVLTNHHCGYGAIQSHSSVENDYLKNGFWAMNRAEELQNPDLYVEFLKYMEEVTNDVLMGTYEGMDETERNEKINANIRALINAKKEASDLLFQIKPFFAGNRYFLLASQRYYDVRLVGAPPSSIGKYGADTDNWMWPRHTGDFSIFRIYADANNNPAKPDADNVPYTPLRHLTISLKPKKEGDFTMVFGYPGTTQEYIPAVAVEHTVKESNVLKIRIRDTKLQLLDKRMRQSDDMRIKYASKYASTSNAWKKWIGQNIGIRETKAISKKRKYEADFMYRLSQNDVLWEKYNHVLPELNYLHRQLSDVALARDYFVEIGYYGIELMRYVQRYRALNRLLGSDDTTTVERTANTLANSIDGFYKDFVAEADEEIMAALMEIYMEQDAEYLAQGFTMNAQLEQGDYSGFTDSIYTNSIFTQDTSTAYLKRMLKEEPYAFMNKLKEDPAFTVMSDFFTGYLDIVRPAYNQLNYEIELLQRQYMQAQIAVFPDRNFYPDANSTLRLTYGLVEGYEPRDAVEYEYQTYLSGVIDKYVPGDYEFDLNPKLINLYTTKDYGRYGEDGKMPVCFIASNHTSGGNSGSPALNGKGELIGLNFDRVWEGTMSDLYFDRSRCRNIMVDIRYVLFVVDKYAGAGYLVDEMTVVE